MALIDREYFESLPLGVKNRAMPYSENLDTFLETASAQVEAYCERKFELQTHVESIYGSGHNTILLNQYPVVQLESISYEDEWTSVPQYIAVDAIRYDESGVLNLKYPGTMGPWRTDRIYIVSYTAGYDPVPAPIKHATALWATELMRPNFIGPQPERPADLVPLSTQQIADLLDNYRRRRLG